LVKTDEDSGEGISAYLTASHKYLGLKLRTVEESAEDEIAWFRQKGWLN
jgi:hypothetical protein